MQFDPVLIGALAQFAPDEFGGVIGVNNLDAVAGLAFEPGDVVHDVADRFVLAVHEVGGVLCRDRSSVSVKKYSSPVREMPLWGPHVSCQTFAASETGSSLTLRALGNGFRLALPMAHDSQKVGLMDGFNVIPCGVLETSLMSGNCR